ncbi:MAG TPA: 3-deoxy-manno-octulosonate cytidylyltransferase [bacterium]|nr:3-deoxy-manno-octulosonate cytidylyltransferase [bacterium]
MSDRCKVVGVIPARYGSTRLPGKILAPIAGKPMIQWVYERAKGSQLLQELFVAADDERIIACVEGFGGKAVMTGTHHQSGTDRIAEAVGMLTADIVVNIQGDQPMLDPRMIDEAVQPMLDHTEIRMATLMTPIQPEDYHDPSVVKVVVDENGYALYFSRSLIPYPRNTENLRVFEHVGLYVYRKDFLLMISQLPQGYLEKIELLEQLRVLEKGYKIFVTETHCASASGVSVDTAEDLAKVEKLIRTQK